MSACASGVNTLLDGLGYSALVLALMSPILLIVWTERER